MGRLERARLIQALSQIRGNGELESRHVRVELRQLGGADDGRRDAGLGRNLVERHLGGRLVHSLRNLE